MLITIPTHTFESLSATKVKAPSKNAVQMQAKKKLIIEDDRHEVVIAKGDMFHVSNDAKGIFLFDADGDLGKFWKFKITKAQFNSIKREHKVLEGTTSSTPKTKAGLVVSNLKDLIKGYVTHYHKQIDIDMHIEDMFAFINKPTSPDLSKPVELAKAIEERFGLSLDEKKITFESLKTFKFKSRGGTFGTGRMIKGTRKTLSGVQRKVRPAQDTLIELL